MIKRGKKGQVTLFIIIAIVVVALGVLAFLFWDNIQTYWMSEEDATTFLQSQAPSVKGAVNYCVKGTSDTLLRQQGLRAGYYTASNMYALDYAGPKYVVMYKDDNDFRINRAVSVPMMEGEFSRAMELEGYQRIDSCMQGTLNDLKKKMDVEVGEKSITAQINDENIIIKTSWPITLKKGTKAVLELQQDDSEILIPMGNVLSAANDIINTEANQTSFSSQYEQYIRSHDLLMSHLKIDIQNYPTSDQTIYMLRTVPSRPGEIEYLFNMAVDRS